MATLAQEIARIAGNADIIYLDQAKNPTVIVADGQQDIRRKDITAYVVRGGVASTRSLSLLVSGLGGGGETAYWLGQEPTDLISERFLTGWGNGPVSESQVISFVNAKWQGMAPNTEGILGLSVEPFGELAVLVFGSFESGGTWHRLRKVLRLPSAQSTVNDVLFEDVA